MNWWALAYLLPGIVLAGVIWEVAVNGVDLPERTDPDSRHQLSLLRLSMEASPKVRMIVVLLIVGVLVAWPLTLFMHSPNSNELPPRTKRTGGRHRR